MVLIQVAGVIALLLIMAAGYSLYQSLRFRKQARSAVFNAERQSAGDQAIRSTLSSIFLFGLALIFFGLALLGESAPAVSVTMTVTPTAVDRRTPAPPNSSPVAVTPAIQPTQMSVTDAPPTTVAPPPASPTPEGQVRKTAVVSGVGDNLLKLRREPATTADIIAQYPDGTVLEVLAEQQTNQGIVWQHVRDAQGNDGWVANQYLVYNP
jgi:uncharacterized protein YgiM (DUF1202 family)